MSVLYLQVAESLDRDDGYPLRLGTAQPQGAPLKLKACGVLRSEALHDDGLALYQPFAWSIWVLRYAGSEDARVRLPAQLGLLTITGGCLTTIGLFFILNMRRIKRLSRNSEDVHGSARWATEGDIRRTGLLDARKGVYVGG